MNNPTQYAALNAALDGLLWAVEETMQCGYTREQASKRVLDAVTGAFRAYVASPVSLKHLRVLATEIGTYNSHTVARLESEF